MEDPVEGVTWRGNYRRKTAYITIGLPFDLLWTVGDIADTKKWSRSNTVGYLVHMGITYLRILDEQALADEIEKEKEDEEV